MQMDLLRSCYYSKMRLIRGHREIQVNGSWHFCLPGSLPIPHLHAFASQIWDAEGEDLDPDIGEVPGLGGYSKGKPNPRLKGKNFCGLPIIWRLGADISLFGTPGSDADGVPFCCDALSRETGGASAGGTAKQEYGYRWSMFGGAVADGEGYWGTGWLMHGGAVADGSGVWGLGWLSYGGAVADGSGTWGTAWAGGTGAVANGSGPFGAGWLSSGGAVADGSGVWGTGWLSSGGAVADGSGVWSLGWPGSGGAVADGSGVWGAGSLGGGGALAGGGGVFSAGFSGTGGAVANGSGDFTTGEDMLTGMIVGWGSHTIPAGWLECDGSDVSQATYPDLYAILSNHFGPTSGGTFRLPNLLSRVPLGAGQGTGLSLYDLGAHAGEEKHTLVTAEMPAHTHNQQTNTYNGTAGGSNLQASLMGGPVLNFGGVTSSVGSGTEHENRQPYLAIVWIIKT